MSQNRPCRAAASAAAEAAEACGWMSVSGKMTECEPQIPAELPVDLLDRVERLPRVRALVVAVLEDQWAGGRAANVIDFFINWEQGQLAVARYRLGAHGLPPGLWVRLSGGFSTRPAGG
jgi:hypothetical protein